MALYGFMDILDGYFLEIPNLMDNTQNKNGCDTVNGALKTSAPLEDG